MDKENSVPKDTTQPSGSVAVIGAGIAGIQAALDLAGMGFHVYVVESKPAIGGIMAMLDKTFPTNDCSLCILSPKLVDCGRHKDIDILTNAEVLGLDGDPGDFSLRVKVNPRYVDPEKCTSCGDCGEKCPIRIPDSYEQGLAFRKAIYKYYPQAIPNAWGIDMDGMPPGYVGCIRCGVCGKVCATGAVDLEQQPEERSLQVGAVVVAGGAEAAKAAIKPEFGYGRYLNVLSNIDFERVLSASGPYEGHILRPSDRAQPSSIAWVQCVASRDRQIGRPWCSSYCCMAAVKEAVISREHTSGLDTSIFYIDMRAFGRDFDAYVERARDQAGVRFVRSRVSEITEDQESQDLFLSYEDDAGELHRERFGMVVLSMGLCAPPGREGLLQALGVEPDEFGFCRTESGDPVRTSREGVFAAGTVTGPMAIPESVTQASSAAGRAASLLREARGSAIREVPAPPELDVAGQEARVGVFVCHCGVNIAGFLEVGELVEHAAGLEGVAYATDMMYSCAQDAQERIAALIREHNLNRVVVTACSPRTHEPLFQETMRQAGLNPSLFEMANIRDQCSWIHMEQPREATRKARDLLAGAVAKARLLEPLPVMEVPVTPAALVVGAGPAGMSSALVLADQGYQVALVEKAEKCGGRLADIRSSLDGLDPAALSAELCERIENHPGITLYTGSRVERVDGFVGNFQSVIAGPQGQVQFDHGAVVLAVGGKPAVPDEYLYGSDPRVATAEELEQRLAGMAAGDIEPGESFVMIQCVGSRTPEYPSCGNVCCSQAVKNSLRIKELQPRAEVFVLYRDVRTYGMLESHYEKAREKGVVFVRYDTDQPPQVEERDGRLLVRVYEQFLRREIPIAANHVVLSSALRPAEDAPQLAAMMKVPLTGEGFFLEAHVKLRPVDFATEGVFVAGTCHAPTSIREAIAQGQAAAARAGQILSQETYRSTALVAVSNIEHCSGCGVCVSVCDYSAVELVREGSNGEEHVRSRVNESLCKGCGCCVAACPSHAMEQRGFTAAQLSGMLHSLLAAPGNGPAAGVREEG